MTVTDPRNPDLETAPQGIPDVVTRLRATFASGRTRPIEWRLAQLGAIERMLTEREGDFVAALGEDLGRPRVDAWLADLAPVTGEVKYARKHLRSWMRRTRVAVPLNVQPGRAWYQSEPLGVALIVGPWNYPVQLLLAPLVAAVAAGDCVVLKPSELTPSVSALLARLVPEYLDADAVAVVEGAAAATQDLLAQGLDHCFFTGGPEIGKIVMAAAAKHLTPVTLELGGKSPTIVAADANIRVAARRVAFGKLLNSGQTCVAPDYVLVDESVRDEFVAELHHAVETMSAGDASRPLPIVSARHAARLVGLIDSAGGERRSGGSVDPDARRAQFTVVVDPDDDSDLMRQEIFGPVLPIVTTQSLDDAIAHVQRGTKPLAVYVFTESRETERRVLEEISNGGTLINHTLYHLLVPGLPFGGVGVSGTGAYHGKFGFDTFSHRKAVLRKPTRPDPSIAYPPFNRVKETIMRVLF